MYLNKNTNNKWLTLIELIISITVLSIFLVSTYTAINSSYSMVGYIDSNINWLNMSKSLIDETINVRNSYLDSYPYDWWEQFIDYYWTWTFKLSEDKCEITDDLSSLYLCPIENQKNQYEWPLNNIWDIITNTQSTHFYRKLEISESNTFYLKNISRQRTSSWELLIFKFTEKIYNKNSLVIYWGFEDNNIDLNGSWLNINYYDIDWNSSTGSFNNINNNNLKYSKILEYNTWSSISNWDNLILSYTWWTYTFKFLDIIPETSTWWLIPIKISTDIHQNYYQLCQEMDKLEIINCNYNYFIKDNFYEKIIWTEKELSNIDFWNNYNFSFSWSNNNEIWVDIVWVNIPEQNTFTYLNPYWKIMHNNNDLNENDFLNIISDSSSWRWIEIPDLPNIIWEINTNTWFTSLLNIKSTTYLYDWNNFIDTFIIESKLWDINRYQNNNE